MNESIAIPEMMSVCEAAEILRLSEQSVRSYLTRAELNGRKVGRAWVVASDSVHALAKRRGTMTVDAAQVAKTKAIRKPKLRALSFFSGAMGLDLGLESAGIQTLLACEFDKWCRQTIEVNCPGLPVLGDIWQYDAKSVRLAAGLEAGQEIDLVHGGPPCQSFSTAGARRGFEDKRGNVFLHFVEIALDLNPRFIVIENVRGLLSAPMKHRPHGLRGKDYPPLANDELPGGALNFVIHLLKQGGYTISFNLYNSANFGSPQCRERVVLICARDGRRVQYLAPTHSSNSKFGLRPWNTFADAVNNLEDSEHHHVEFPEDRLRYYRLLKPGQYWKHLPRKLQEEALGNSFHSGGGKTGFLRRLAWDKPSPTLVTYPAMPATDLAHPEEDRPLSIEEYKRIQEFPDTWSIQGPLLQQYKQVGNAVPVSLGAAIGRVLIAHSLGKELKVPVGFRYSRYQGTSDLDRNHNGVSKSSGRKKARNSTNELKLF